MKLSTSFDGPVTITIESKKDPKAQLKWEKEQKKKAQDFEDEKILK